MRTLNEIRNSATNAQEHIDLLEVELEQLRAEVEKMKFTAREMELLSGMVDVHQSHADRCDRIPSRMASKQKGYDLERVALLKRIIKAGEVDDVSNRE